jgi:hypothetical protein
LLVYWPAVPAFVVVKTTCPAHVAATDSANVRVGKGPLPTGRLMQVWRARESELVYTPSGEIIWLKNEAGDLVDYKDTRETKRLRRTLEPINEGLATLQIEIPSARRRSHLLVIDGSYVLPTPGNALQEWQGSNRNSWPYVGRTGGNYSLTLFVGPRSVRVG